MNSEPFNPNNHSKSSIEYHPVASDEFQLIASIFAKYYGEKLDKIITIQQVNEAEINSNNFRVNYESNGTKKTLLVRRYANARDRAMLEDIAVVLKELRMAGARVPEIILSHSGKIIELEGEYSYTAYKFIDGNHFQGTLAEIASTADEIGKIHALLSDLPSSVKLKDKVKFPAHTLKLREYSSEIWNELFERAKERLTNSTDPDFDKHIFDLKDIIMTAVESTPAHHADQFKKQLVHFDLHPHNILTDGASLLAVIDFDSLRNLEHMRAVSFALHRLVRQHVVFSKPENVDKAIKNASRVFLDNYCRAMPLSLDDVGSIAYFIRAEALARLTYAMKDYYHNGNPLWKGDLDKQTASIVESKYFEIS